MGVEGERVELGGRAVCGVCKLSLVTKEGKLLLARSERFYQRLPKGPPQAASPSGLPSARACSHMCEVSQGASRLRSSSHRVDLANPSRSPVPVAVSGTDEIMREDYERGFISLTVERVPCTKCPHKSDNDKPTRREHV